MSQKGGAVKTAPLLSTYVWFASKNVPPLFLTGDKREKPVYNK